MLRADLEVAYRDSDGAARLLYFDRQYNHMLGLMHEDAQEDSVSLTIEGTDANVLDVRLRSALDLAVSKLGRFSSQDREDIATLARHKRINSAQLRKRAAEALGGYVGDTARLEGSIAIAVRIVADIEARGGGTHRPS